MIILNLKIEEILHNYIKIKGGHMKKSVDLVSGNIFSYLFKLSILILGTSFIQMAYNMTDMMWVGRIIWKHYNTFMGRNSIYRT